MYWLPVIRYRAGRAIGKFGTVKRNRPMARNRMRNCGLRLWLRQETSIVSPTLNSSPVARGFSFNQTRVRRNPAFSGANALGRSCRPAKNVEHTPNDDDPLNICKHIDDCLQRTSDDKDAKRIREGMRTRNGKMVLVGTEAYACDLGRKRPMGRLGFRTAKTRSRPWAAGSAVLHNNRDDVLVSR